MQVKRPLARKLAGILSVLHIQLDFIHGKPSRVSRPHEGFRQLTRETVRTNGGLLTKITAWYAILSEIELPP